MNKQQRDYSTERIKEIARKKQFKCECEKPSLHAHIRRAIAAKTAKLRTAKDITMMFETRIMEAQDRYDMKADIKDLYEAPQSYKDAMAELKAEQDKHEAENESTYRYAQSLIDQIELGEFEDGKEPIRLMEAYTPKPPKAKAR